MTLVRQLSKELPDLGLPCLQIALKGASMSQMDDVERDIFTMNIVNI